MALLTVRNATLLLLVSLLQISSADAQTVGAMYKKCKYWELNGFPKKLTEYCNLQHILHFRHHQNKKTVLCFLGITNKKQENCERLS